MKKYTPIKHEAFDNLMDDLNTDVILDNYIRQVRWLYHNSNKCTMVYEEKLVRLIVFRLKTRIRELERNIPQKL
jgi:hypothetical protein